MSEINEIEVLLDNAGIILKHQEEIKNLRGENFNIFTILKMESKENATHSAFLGELLNPKGSHLLRTKFLEFFLQSIDHKVLDITTAKLLLEKHIGYANKQDKTGGRIDIYIQDDKNNTISIENKIYANDQEVQIERYVNHNKEKNTVYYLTLNGDLPSNGSKGSLENKQDFFCISYKVTIIDWLQKCLKESAEQPILRESIKQYIILIKKLTNQLTDNNMAVDIQSLIKSNYNSAKIIADNIWKLELNTAAEFLNSIKLELETDLKEGEGWTITIDKDLNKAWSGLIIEFVAWGGISIKLEGVSTVPWSRSIYGIVANQAKYDRVLVNSKLDNISILKNNFLPSVLWPYFKTIMSFQTNEERARLFNAKERNELLENVSTQLKELAIECKIPLSNIPKK